MSEPRCVLCGSVKNLDDRGPYILCGDCVIERRECKERSDTGEILDRDCSPLCTRCGLCCVVLSAEVSPEEVEKLSYWSGMLPTEIAMPEGVSGFEGKLVLKRPCPFLLGKPAQYVSCRAYSTDRPRVCKEYLCKQAIRYKSGSTTLNEALFILRAATTGWGNLALFNWTSGADLSDDKEDASLMGLVVAQRTFQLLNEEDPVDLAKLALFEQTRPNYRFASKEHGTVFAAIVSNYRTGMLALDQFFSPEEIGSMDSNEKATSLRAVYQVVKDISDLFVPYSQS